METKGTLSYLVSHLVESRNKKDITRDHLWYAIRNAMTPNLLINNIAEALRVSAAETEQLLKAHGFGDMVARNKKVSAKDENEEKNLKDHLEYFIAKKELRSPFQDIFSIEFTPPINKAIKLSKSSEDAITNLTDSIIESAKADPFLALYRIDVMDYYNQFITTDAKLIDDYIKEKFKNSYPKYILNSGIGANEQFNHFIAHLNNADPGRKCNWLIIDSPRNLVNLPVDATVDNTLFMEFSRSGKTEETVKIHEYTPREAKRIVFANLGPLREIGKRDKNLLLELPDQVAGRFGRNKTPILLAPMHVAQMETKSYWNKIDEVIGMFDISSPDNLPLQLAQFIYLYQNKNNINHIYLGCNDDILATSADELLQFWNEGVNKDENDISMSRYFGLLRDSHLNIEGILANHKTKMGIFLLRNDMSPPQLPPMTAYEIDPINPDHSWLRFGDEEKVLAEANYKRFAELMPTIKITVNGDFSLDHSAVLGQLWSDITFCYSKLVNVDPGSNPEVKFVRDRAAELLAISYK